MHLPLEPTQLLPDLLEEALPRLVPDPRFRREIGRAAPRPAPSAALEGAVLEHWARTVSWSGVDVVVALGLGSGLLVDLLRSRSRAKLLVLEPRPEVVRAVLSEHPLRYPDIRIYDDLIQLRAGLRALCRFGLRVMLFAPPWAREELAGQVADLEATIREAHQLTLVNDNTERAFGQGWNELILDGLERFAGLVPVNRLSGALAGVPGVVVASGPDLDRNIELLERLEGRAAICALNSSLSALDRHDIRPDLLATVESKDIVNMVAGSPALANLTLVPGLHTHPSLFELPLRAVLPVVSGHQGVARWLARQARLIPLASGGSVACQAFSVLEALGCDPIVLVGQSCALAGERMYAAGTRLEGLRYEAAGEGAVRLKTNEPILRLRAGPGRPIEPRQGRQMMRFAVPAWGGGQVYTIPQLNTYRLWFEEKAHVLAGRRRLINATEGGASISGFEELPLRRVCGELSEAPVDAGGALVRAAGRASPLDGAALARGLRAEAGTCREARRLAGEAEKVTARLLRLLARSRGRSTKARRALARLGELERSLRDLTPRALLLDAFVGSELEKVRRSAVRLAAENPEEGTRGSLEHSREIFRAISHMSQDLEPRLEGLAARLERQGRTP